jgi:hypothetical protein
VINQQAFEKKGFKNHDFMATARTSFYGGCKFPQLNPFLEQADMLRRRRLRTRCYRLVQGPRQFCRHQEESDLADLGSRRRRPARFRACWYRHVLCGYNRPRG